MPARRRPRTFAPAMMAGAVLLLAAVPARAQDAHGAIAFGQIAQDPAVAYGFAWDYPTRDEAQEAAMNACLDSGGSDCAVLAWFQNGCGALAMDQYGMAQGKGARSLEQAEARAVRTCEAAGGVGCAVVESQCVSQGGQPGTWSGSESVLTAPEEGSSVPTADALEDERLTSEERLQVQQGLAALGFDAGPADGMFGPRTRSAIREWQQAKGLETTGYLSREEAEVLAAAGAREQPASRETAEPDGPGNQVLYFAATGPKCAELGSYLGERDAACWEEIQSQPGCYIWSVSPSFWGVPNPPGRSADWTGECSGDTAHGRGSYSLSYEHERRGSEQLTGTGAVMHGKQNGPWVWRDADGYVVEGSYVDGMANGNWVWRSPTSSGGGEGPYVDGKRHGYWVSRYTGGAVHEGPYVDDERHGHWVIRESDGDVEEGLYVDGKRHGRWVIRYASGGSLEHEYRNGSREGMSGIYQTSDGNRYPGRWSGDCFRDAEGRAWVWYGTKEDACGS